MEVRVLLAAPVFALRASDRVIPMSKRGMVFLEPWVAAEALMGDLSLEEIEEDVGPLASET